MSDLLGGMDMLGYSVRISRLHGEDGGGWIAEIPELPGCFSDGETPEEALQSIQKLLPFWMQVAKEEGRPIPQPLAKASAQCSGKFTLRVPKTLHRSLALAAEAEGVSLNQYVLTLISLGIGERVGASKIAVAENAPASAQQPKARATLEIKTQTLTIEDGRQYEDLQPLLFSRGKGRVLGV